MKRFAAIGLLSCFVLTTAYAEQPAPPAVPPTAPMDQAAPAPAAPTSPAPVNGKHKGKGKGACAQDVQTLCAGVERGGGRIRKCLSEHADQVSPACKAAQEERKALHKAIKTNCKGDIQKLCPDAKHNKQEKGGVLQCLTSKTDQLSAGCAKALNDKLD
jgi:hypothetical protein